MRDGNVSEEYFDKFLEYNGKGFKPSTTFGGLAYLCNQKTTTQRRIANDLGCSVVSVRNSYQRLEEDDELELEKTVTGTNRDYDESK